MHRIIMIIACLIVSGCSAVTQQPINSYSYNLDVPSNRYSALDFKDVGGHAVVKVCAKFIEQRKTPEWNPSASFQLFSKDGNGYAALVIPSRENGGYQPFLITKKRHPETNEIVESEPLFIGEDINFNEEFTLLLSWFSNNDLLVRINGGEIKSVPLGFSVSKFRSSNSAGEIDVISMVIEKCNKSKHSDAASCAGV